MTDDGFQEVVLEKLINIENRLSILETEVRTYVKFVKIVIAILSFIASLFGVNLANYLQMLP